MILILNCSFPPTHHDHDDDDDHHHHHHRLLLHCRLVITLYLSVVIPMHRSYVGPIKC